MKILEPKNAFLYGAKKEVKKSSNQKMTLLKVVQKGLEILIAVVFCKECVLPVQ